MSGRAKLRIFVVDDDAVIATTLALILNSQDYEAIAYTDPAQALKAARAKRPDLLISDVLMPSMTGIDLAIQLRRACHDCKVLLFSGQASTADLLATARAQGYDFDLILKPIHPAILLRKIQQEFESVPQRA